MAKTISGRECQNQSKQKPQAHKYEHVGKHNYCRNPDDHVGVWWYTTDEKKRWEDCPVPKFGAGGRSTSRRGRSILAASGETFEEEEGDSNNDNEESELDGPINIESAVTSDKCLSHSDNDYLSDF